MSSISASTARQNLFPLLKQVNDDDDVVRITSKGGNGVLMSEAEYESWETTRHLFSTPVNARRLIESIAQARSGRLVDYDPRLLEDDG
jgi:antitoxin YefM